MLLLSLALGSPLVERCVEDGTIGVGRALALEQTRVEGFTNPAGALARLEPWLEELSDCGAVWMQHAAVLQALGRTAEARESLKQADALGGPEAARAHLLVELRQPSPSESVIQRALESGDVLLGLLAVPHLAPSQQTDAYEVLLEGHADHEPLWVALVRTMDEAGRPREALARGADGMQQLKTAPTLEAELARINKPFAGPGKPREARPAEFRVLEDGTEEYVIYSSGTARRALEERMEDLGYRPHKEVKGGMLYKAEGPIRPTVTIFDDGRIDVQKSGIVSTKGLSNEQASTMIPMISARKMRGRRAAVLEAVQYELTAWRQARTREAFGESLSVTLPQKMDALWERGVPFYGDTPVPSGSSRRDELASLWASRACSPEGDAARRLIADFILNEVQESDVAYTTTELARVEAQSACTGRMLRATPR